MLLVVDIFEPCAVAEPHKANDRSVTTPLWQRHDAFVRAKVLRRASGVAACGNDHLSNMPFVSMNRTTSATPVLVFKLLITNGRAPRMRRVSAAITSRLAPT